MPLRVNFSRVIPLSLVSLYCRSTLVPLPRPVETDIVLRPVSGCLWRSSMIAYKKAVASVSTFSALALAGIMLVPSPHLRANDADNDESKVQQGFEIAPVPLNLAGKNRALVGLGSYIVNAVGDCNGCHS